MEGIIFWLMPMALLVVLIVIVTSQLQQPHRRLLLFCEPLGVLIKRWRVVRLVGAELRLRQLLAALYVSKLDDDSSINLLLQFVDPPLPVEADLVEARPLSALGEQRIIRYQSQTTSVLIGSVAGVLPACRYRSDGRTLLTQSDRAEWNLTAERAGHHGYVVVALAEKAVQSKVVEAQRHTFLGLVFLEPVLDERTARSLSAIPESRQKFLSALPVSFLLYLRSRLADRSLAEPHTVDASPTSPAMRETMWQQSPCLGEQNFDDKYAVVRYYESRRSCRMVSGVAADSDLPLSVKQTI